MTEGDANVELSKLSSIKDARIADEINKDPQFVRGIRKTSELG